MAEDFNRHITKKDIWMANKDTKRCSMLWATTGEMQIERAASCHYASIRMANSLRKTPVRMTGSLSPFSHTSISSDLCPRFSAASVLPNMYLYLLNSESLLSLLICTLPTFPVQWSGKSLLGESWDVYHKIHFTCLLFLFSQSCAVCCLVSAHVCIIYIFQVFSCLWQ